MAIKSAGLPPILLSCSSLVDHVFGKLLVYERFKLLCSHAKRYTLITGSIVISGLGQNLATYWLGGSYLSKKDFCFHTHVCIFPAIFL